MIRFHAERMITSRYVASYKHLDESEDLGFTFKVVFGKTILSTNRHGEVEFDSGYTQYAYITTSRPVTKKELKQAMHCFDRQCACEHDCCGHYNGGAWTHKLRAKGRQKARFHRRWSIPVNYNPNL